MTREEFENWVDEPEDNVQDTVDTLFEYVRQLQKENEFIEQQNAELQARIKELEDQYETLHLHFVEQSNAFEDPKTCNGCEFENYTFVGDEVDKCVWCLRKWDNRFDDNYEPKQNHVH